jgi:hypothetical protein
MHDSILKVTVGCTFLKEVQPGDDDTSTVLTDDHGGAEQVFKRLFGGLDRIDSTYARTVL